MSNPAVCFLATTSFRGVSFRIEDNLGESIHIHYGMIRIVLSIDEFFLLASSIRVAAEQLLELNGIVWDNFDAESLKYEWVDEYTKLASKKCKSVKLDSLFMKESYIQNRSIKRVIPLQESGYVRLLQGDTTDIDYYSEPGKYELSRKEKVEAIGKIIDHEGYPFEQKRILVNQEGYILDGIKRASYLYYKYGGEEKVLVDEISLQGLDSVEIRRNIAEQQIDRWLADRGSLNCQTNTNDTPHIRITMGDIIKRLKDNNVDFFVVDREKVIEHKNLVSSVIVVEEQKFDLVQEIFSSYKADAHPYEGYGYLYGLKKPLAIEMIKGMVLIYDKPACKSRFEKELLPMDQHVNELCWKHIIWNDERECYQLDSEMLTFWAVIDSILEFNRFSPRDISLIEKYSEIFEKDEYIEALEKEFFRYTPNLITYLLSRQYSRVLEMYEKFSDY